MVIAGNIILGSTIVGLERRINFLESIVINLAVAEGNVNQYPIRTGASTGSIASFQAKAIDVSKNDGLILASSDFGTSLSLSLWGSSGQLWVINAGESSSSGVARDSSGNVYATSRVGLGSGDIFLSKYNSSQILQWTTNEWEIDPGPPPVMDTIRVAEDCALTNDEQHLWVCESFGPRMVKFATADGSFVSEFDLAQVDEVASRPEHVAIDVNGNLYVTDSQNEMIQKFNSQGTFQTKWGGSGTGDGQFTEIEGIAVATSRRSNNDVFVFVLDTDRILPLTARVNVFDKSGTLLWDRPVDSQTPPDVEIVWGAQTEWFYYPTEDQSQSVSAGTPDGGRVVPAINFYDNQIIRANIIGHMHIVIEILAAGFINAGTGNTFNWTGSDADNLYHVAVEAGEYDWLRPRNADLEDETIRPDEITEIELCLTKLEQSFILTT